MAMTREEVKVVLGVDSSAMGRGLSTANQHVDKFAKATSRTFLKIGQVIASAFAFRSIISSLREVSEEIDKLYDNIDARRYKDDQRKKQLSGMSSSDKESILAGDAQIDSITNTFKTFMSKGAGLYAFAAGTAVEFVKNFHHEKRIFEQLGQAAAKASDKQRDIVQGMKDAAVTVAAEEREKERAENKKKARIKLVADIERVNDQMVARSKKRLADELETRKKISEAIADAGVKAKNLYKAYDNLVRGMSDVSLADAYSMTDSALGDLQLSPLQLSRQQMEDLDRTRVLQRDAQQARLNGNTGLADQLSMERTGILNRMGFLSESERNPFVELQKQSIEQTAAMKSLAEQALNAGLNVVIKNLD